MRLIAPTIDVDEIATAELICKAVDLVQGKDNPYLILEASDLTYAQTLWVGNGFELEYQIGSIDQHFQSTTVLSAQKVKNALVSYLLGQNNWHDDIEFKLKDIRGRSGRLGYKLGKIIGKIFRA